MVQNKQKGFTLIELLVVIAIIGILASIVLVSLGSARAKGNDAKIEGQLSSMRAQAQLYTASAAPTGEPAAAGVAGAGINPIAAAVGNMFSDTTPGSNSLDSLISGLPGATPVYFYATPVLPSGGGIWVFAAATSTGAFCVDYNGVAKSWTGTPTPVSSGDFLTAFPALATGACS